jgi:hypothetical protein
MQRAPFHTFRKISFNLAPSMKTTYSAIYLGHWFVVPHRPTDLRRKRCSRRGEAIDAVMEKRYLALARDSTAQPCG